MSSSRTVGRFVSLHASSNRIPPQFCSFSDVNRGQTGDNRTWALDVADNASGGIVHELNSDLGDTSTGTYSITHTSASYSLNSIFPTSICEVEHTSAA